MRRAVSGFSPACAGEISEGNTAAAAPVAAAPDFDVGLSGGLADGDTTVGAAGTSATGGASVSGAGAAGGSSKTGAGPGAAAKGAPASGAGGAGVASAADGFSLVSQTLLRWKGLIDGEIEFQHIDMRLPQYTEHPAGRVLSDQRRIWSSGMLRDFATRGTWNKAAAGVMSGSSPLAEVVTRSTGTLAEGFVAANWSASPFTRSTSAFDVGPKFEPDELLAL